MKIAVHAGHNPDGKIACGAVGYLRESTCARKVANELCDLLLGAGVDCHNVTVDDGKNQKDILNRLNAAVKSFTPELSISIHLNAYTMESANGCEIYTKDESLIALGESIMDEVQASTGIKKRRVITTSNLSVIMPKNVGCPALLVECCFVTNPDDAYKFDAAKIAAAIFKALRTKYGLAKPAEDTGGMIYVQVGAFKKMENAKALVDALKKDGYPVYLKKEG